MFAQRGYRALLEPVGLALGSIGALVVVRLALSQLESWRDAVTREIAFVEPWRFFLVCLLLAAVGCAVTMVVGRISISGGFEWRRSLALGIVPFTLGLTAPALYGDWPLARDAGFFQGFRFEFVQDGYIVAAWFLVGVAVAAGFSRRTA